MLNKTLSEIVAENPFPDFQEWWEVGIDFASFMSNAIVSEWQAIEPCSHDLGTVHEYADEYLREVFGKQADQSLIKDFVEKNPDRQFLSGEFDAISYAFYRSAFEQFAEHINHYENSLEVERRQFTVRVGARFFQQLANHLALDLPSSLDSEAEFQQLKAGTQKVGMFLSDQGYLRDHFAFTFDVHVDYADKHITQDEADVLPRLESNGMAYALYEMGYPIILPSAVYLYHTIGEAQHHSSRTIEELFKRVGYDAYETDDFDPIEYPSDMVVELWEIRPLA